MKASDTEQETKAPELKRPEQKGLIQPVSERAQKETMTKLSQRGEDGKEQLLQLKRVDKDQLRPKAECSERV